MSSISQQGGDRETARAIARPPFLFLVALLLGFVSDHLVPLPFPISRIGPAHWISAVIAGSLILIGIGIFAAGIRNFSASSGDEAYASAGDDRNSRLEPQSHLPRNVSRLWRYRHSRAQPVDFDPRAASRHHHALRRGRARRGLSRAALRRCLPRLQGACPPLAVAVKREEGMSIHDIGNRIPIRRFDLLRIGATSRVVVLASWTLDLKQSARRPTD